MPTNPAERIHSLCSRLVTIFFSENISLSAAWMKALEIEDKDHSELYRQLIAVHQTIQEIKHIVKEGQTEAQAGFLLQSFPNIEALLNPEALAGLVSGGAT
jgi:hypothetical protein